MTYYILDSRTLDYIGPFESRQAAKNYAIDHSIPHKRTVAEINLPKVAQIVEPHK